MKVSANCWKCRKAVCMATVALAARRQGGGERDLSRRALKHRRARCAAGDAEHTDVRNP